MARQKIAILGSTGSIGEQTLEVTGLHGDLFEPVVLTAHRNWQTLSRQARLTGPDSVVIADKAFYEPLKQALADLPIKVWAGEDAVAAAAEASGVDVVVNALVGYSGLIPTVRAVSAGKKVALANKESLVAGGELVMRLAAENRSPIVPVDSEHSAILQCLVGEPSPPRRIVLTASGGALRDVPPTELDKVSPERALAHPNWKMGAKITIDSATLVNKGFEVVEAAWLFGMESSRIDVLLHPQSVVHSMVEFRDGSVKAQLGTPDMRVPISYALSFPARLPLPDDDTEAGNGAGSNAGTEAKTEAAAVSTTGKSSGVARLSLTDYGALTFAEVDAERYPALQIARDCMAAGGTACCTMNAANEVAVAAFLAGRIRFTDIVRTIRLALDKAPIVAHPTLEDYIECNARAREIANEIISLINTH